MRKRVHINNIKPNKENPRTINKNKIKKLIKSLQDFPEMLEKRPLVVDENMVVLGGNMRLKALQKAGIKEVTVDIAKGWNEEQKKEFIIKDNIGFGEWDFEILANDWDTEKLNEWGLDFDFKIEPEAKEDDYTEPDKLKVDVFLGDLIEIGEHRLLCGDSTDADQVEKLMNDKKADMVFTDPPYGMNAVTKSGVLSKKYDKDIIGDDNTDSAKDSFNLIYTLFPQATHIWWGANYYSSCLPDSECWLVWDKNNGQSDQTDCELAWSNARSVVRQFTKASEKTNRVHPTQKPIELIIWSINKFNKNANLICDFFLGSGSTMVACQQLNRKCYGMELDPKYCQVIIDRMLNFDSNLEVKINGKKYKSV
tara:strand:+ start:114 stop:1211 length:1098 start_codon:yes stop_codon:yes gene_type:complete